MKTIYARRYRRPVSRSRDAGIARKEHQPEPTFFAAPSVASFFKPASNLQRKCDACEAEDKKASRQPDTKEEEKPVQKMEDKEEDKSIQKATANQEEKEVQKAADKKEEKPVQATADTKEEKEVQKAADNKEEDKAVQAMADKQEDKKAVQRSAQPEKEKQVAAKEAGARAASDYIYSLDGKGEALPEETRHFFGERMGYDFRQVKIHTGTEAEQSAKAVNAKAFAVDHHLVFNKGQYNPGSAEGRKLLAHELTHIVQNNKAGALHRDTQPIQEDPDKTVVASGKATNSANKTGHGGCAGVQVQGQTDANYSDSYTSSGRTRPATTCEACSPPECITARGTIVSVFRARPTVTLPAVPDGLSPCEERAVGRFINTTLRRHEQQHVTAFNTYNATIRTPYRYTGCESGLAAELQAMHDAINARRQAAANSRSDALDPFVRPIPCNCE